MVEEIEVESPRRGEVMLQIAACGVCHSDLSATNGTIPMPPPTVLGHEAAGKIVELGEGVTDLKVGDTVVVSWVPMCGKCRYCVEGRPALCDASAKATLTLPDGTSRLKDAKGNTLNHFAGVGVMAEYATLHRDSVIPIDADVAARQGGARRLRGDDRRRRGDQHREGAPGLVGGGVRRRAASG